MFLLNNLLLVKIGLKLSSTIQLFLDWVRLIMKTVTIVHATNREILFG